MAFDEVLFPTDISYGSEGGPEFSTEVIVLGSGFEQRNQNWSYPRERWNVAYGVRDTAALDTLREFFFARFGQFRGFRFRSPDDNEATTLQELGTGDGSTVDFQLVKHYGTLTRKITKPVDGTVQVYIDSVLTSAFTVDATTGIVTMDTAPNSGEVVYATFEFDLPVRFATDHFIVQLTTLNARASGNLPVIELKQ